ncbi:hypothetical protein NDU88_005789 [Pleurodeles waltl]|uniref:Uncharacterized protein n=1 Tax=Pleurodeles waltl TaxID=8319 RepID=A0AAV7VMY2_PLEWA|nr:hypothetical protein NDU88_005789 [Pleurodeles waltl]
MREWPLMEEELQSPLVDLHSKLANMITKQMQALKSDLVFGLANISKEIRALGEREATNKDNIITLNQDLEKLQKTNAKLEEKIACLWEKCTDLEDRSRRDNMQILHVWQVEEGEDIMCFFTALFQVILQDDKVDNIPIIRVHSAGALRSETDYRSQDILVKLDSSPLKGRILSAARKMEVPMLDRLIEHYQDLSQATLNK